MMVGCEVVRTMPSSLRTWLVLSLLVGVASSSGVASRPNVEARSWDDLVVGDVIATAEGEAGHCTFEDFSFEIPVATRHTTRTLGLAASPTGCAILVSQKSETHAESIERPLDAIHLTNPNRGGPDVGAIDSVFAAQTVFMYGYGGLGDRLTTIYNEIYFTYTGSTASLQDLYFNCDAPGGGPWWHWVRDACQLDSQYWGPAWAVWSDTHGNYHCGAPGTFPCSASSPDGYYHSLFNSMEAHGNGGAYCHGSYTGQIISWAQQINNCTVN
jgi:hypothetical protein